MSQPGLCLEAAAGDAVVDRGVAGPPTAIADTEPAPGPVNDSPLRTVTG
jgi:hypothetical protein